MQGSEPQLGWDSPERRRGSGSGPQTGVSIALWLARSLLAPSPLCGISTSSSLPETATATPWAPRTLRLHPPLASEWASRGC